MTKLRIFYYNLFYSPKFIISINSGTIVCETGTVKGALRHDLQDVISDCKIESGLICCVNKGTYLISGNLSEDDKQKIRNICSCY